jgi:hypothetical protein
MSSGLFCALRQTNSRSFDCASRDETARGFAQDDTVFGVGRSRQRHRERRENRQRQSQNKGVLPPFDYVQGQVRMTA